MTEETLFHEALARPAGERPAFLDAACAGRPELRVAVEELLAAHEAPASWLDRPPLGPASSAEVEPGPQRPTAVADGTSEPDAARLVATTDHQPPSAPGLDIAGRYTLVERLGEGGMGEVWVARQTEPVKRKVALKLIKAGMDSKAMLARFEQERQALALMDHPNIARVLDGGLTPDGRSFFAMELVNGLPLTRFCDEAKLTPRQRLELFVPVCQAVQHAHQKGIIHRDLKPLNILVTLVDGRGVPKVIDFGVAKATAGKLTDASLSTQLGAVVGTFEYMAPEQAGYAGEDVDTRADVYALGVILYELLTGLRPIDARRLHRAALVEVVRLIREEEPPRPSTRLSTDAALPSLAALRQTEPRRLVGLLRGELDWVVMKCLEKQRDRRYESANGLARDLQRYLADEPVEARPPSAGYRLGKFYRRHRGAVVAAGLVLAALLTGIGGTAWQALRATQAEKNIAAAYDELAREQVRTAAALEGETTARVHATNALDLLSHGALEELLGQKESHTEAEKAYLRKVLEAYKSFAAVQGETEAARALRGRGLQDVGWLQATLGEKSQVLNNYRQALEIYEGLHRDFPANREYARLLAHCNHALGAELETGPEAIDHLRQGIELYRSLDDQSPGNEQIEDGLAAGHVSLAVHLEREGRAGEAAAENEKALRLLERSVAQSPRPFNRVALGALLGNLAIELRRQGRWAEAEGHWRRAMELRQAVAADDPTNPQAIRNLANDRFGYASLLADRSRFAEADALLELARPALVELARTYPAVIAHKQSLAELHRVTARVELRRGNLTASRAASEAEVRVLRPLADRYPDRPKFQADLVAAWLNCVRAGARAKPRENVDEPMGLALAAAVELCARKDVSRAVRLELSDTLTGTATHFSYLELFPEADRLVRVALPLNEALDREQPDNPVVLRRLAENHGVLRDLFRARGDNAAVERENKAAIAGYERALRLAPDDAAVAVALGGETCNYAGLFRDRGQYAEAIPLFTRAADLLRPHTRPPLRVDHSPTFLVNTLTGRAYCYFHIKKFREAAADYGALAALTEGDEHVGNRNSQIKFLVKAGDVAAVLPVVEETMQQHPGFRPAMFWGATHYARLAGTKEATPGQKAAFADGAMKLLTALVKLGFEEPKLLAGSDFDALRARPDFKKMIADLEARVAPKDKPAPPPRDGKK